jgi:hypothetical protein
LYKDDGKNQRALSVNIDIEVTPINLDGSPSGSAQLFGATVTGSDKTRNICAKTLKA